MTFIAKRLTNFYKNEIFRTKNDIFITKNDKYLANIGKFPS